MRKTQDQKLEDEPVQEKQIVVEMPTHCPNCGVDLEENENLQYCPYCGISL